MAFKMTANQRGWGVYRIAPWHMLGIYPTEAEADVEAAKVGCQYTVAFGSSHALTGTFIPAPAPVG
jgi:hypothetical protein